MDTLLFHVTKIHVIDLGRLEVAMHGYGFMDGDYVPKSTMASGKSVV